MGKQNQTRGKKKGGASSHRYRAQNAFDLAQKQTEGEYIKGMRRQNEINLSEDEDNSDQEKEAKPYNIGHVNSSDDEELDDDGAMASSDDELDFFSRGQKKPEDKEDEDEEEDDDTASVDESEFVSLSTAWDLDDGKPVKGKLESSEESSGQSSEEEEESSDDSESELDLDSDVDPDELNEEEMAKLRNLVAGMASANEEQRIQEKAQRRANKLQLGGASENEFAVPVSSKITLEDLAGDHDALDKDLFRDAKGQYETPRALAVPGSKSVQQRHDREAAFDLARKEVSRWQSTVNRNRDADHLEFAGSGASRELKPVMPQQEIEVDAQTELEQRISNILKQSHMTDENAIKMFEDLAPSKLSMEELRKRRAELRAMRELMFREEQRSKRIKKIKSKSYRKVHRKEREKERELVEGVNSEGEEMGSDKEEHDAQRARERMSLKHKNTSKWAKRMVTQGFTKDKETRAEMEEMLRRGEKLRSKILNEDGGSGSENEYDIDDLERPAADGIDRSSLGKGLMNMKFMVDAEERQRKQNDKDLAELRAARGETGFEDIQEKDDDSDNEWETVNHGRKSFRPKSLQAQQEVDEELRAAYEDYAQEKQTGMAKTLQRGFSKTLKPGQEEIVLVNDDESEGEDGHETQGKSANEDAEKEADGDEANPWLNIGESHHKSQKMSNDKQPDRIKLQAGRAQAKGKTTAENAKIDMDKVLAVDATQGDKSRKRKATVVFSQQELVERAFAGDDVAADFEQEKQQMVEAEGDKLEDVTLPGWGSWGGQGVSKPKKRVIRRVGGVAAKDRQDAKLKNVIISQEATQTNAKYQAPAVMFPYEDKDQYEKSMRMPIGPEWTSRNTFQRGTKPRAIVKQGTVIDPLKAPF